MLRATLLLTVFLVAGCTSGGSGKTQLPPLQVREFQTRTYDTTDTAMVMKALLNVLQDEGFIIKTASADLGLITASKEKTGREWHGGFLYAYDLKYSWECSVNVTPFGRQTKVRVNVQMTAKTLPHGAESVTEIDDPTYYQELFSKVDKGVFIQKERL